MDFYISALITKVIQEMCRMRSYCYKLQYKVFWVKFINHPFLIYYYNNGLNLSVSIHYQKKYFRVGIYILIPPSPTFPLPSFHLPFLRLQNRFLVVNLSPQIAFDAYHFASSHFSDIE